MTTGKTVQTLNSLKQRLHALLSESESLQKEIAARSEQLRKVREDNAAVGGDISTEQRARKRLGQQQAETSDMPQVLDYVAQKAEMYDLHDNLRNWERKVEIMEMAAKRARKLAMTGAM
jgi:chromosome segregation ATPase